MMYIHLHDLRCYGYHGVFDEERILGNEYLLNISVGFEPTAFPISQLDHTIDYTAVLQLVKERMLQPTPLLETLVCDIAASIQTSYPFVSEISISVKKLYPPVNSFEGSVGVSFEWNK